MNFYDAVREISTLSGVSETEAFEKMGKHRSYISRARSRGSVPQVDNASDIVEAFGWKLVAVPSDEVPEVAVQITSGHEKPDDGEQRRQIAAIQRKLESLQRQSETIQRQSEELQKRLRDMG
jgi:hypothetical protein